MKSSNVNLRILPKVELHLHLDCCLSYDVVRRLAPDVTPEAFARDSWRRPSTGHPKQSCPKGQGGYWLMDRLDETLLTEITRRIVAVSDPQQIIIFGSQAHTEMPGRTATWICW